MIHHPGKHCPFKGQGEGKGSNIIPWMVLLSWAKWFILHLPLTVLVSRGVGSPVDTPIGLPKPYNVLKI